MKTYKGFRLPSHGAVVDVYYTISPPHSDPLNPRNDLRNHSPDGFEWGYGGSGPAQLALALIADAVDDRTALETYQEFKWAVVAHLPSDHWELTQDQIKQVVEKIQQQRKEDDEKFGHTRSS